ncbi:MAG: C40 family peptidase [Oligoflexia bacterium]|nr:C40 family peptidase [Oligoflexia bacterium]
MEKMMVKLWKLVVSCTILCVFSYISVYTPVISVLYAKTAEPQLPPSPPTASAPTDELDSLTEFIDRNQRKEHLVFTQEPILYEFLQNYAMTFLDIPYKSYNKGEGHMSGMDCSAFTQFFFSNIGTELPRSSREQLLAKNLLPMDIKKENLKPFDLLFFKKTPKKTVNHVAIYLGEGLMIHASSSNKRIIVDPFLKSKYWQKRFFRAKRPNWFKFLE